MAKAREQIVEQALNKWATSKAYDAITNMRRLLYEIYDAGVASRAPDSEPKKPELTREDARQLAAGPRAGLNH